MSFTSSPQPLLGTSDTAHLDDIQQHGVSHLGPHSGMAEDNTELHTMAQITGDEDLEMRRPPYLHVSSTPTMTIENFRTDRITGYASRRNWRNQW